MILRSAADLATHLINSAHLAAGDPLRTSESRPILEYQRINGGDATPIALLPDDKLSRSRSRSRSLMSDQSPRPPRLCRFFGCFERINPSSSNGLRDSLKPPFFVCYESINPSPSKGPRNSLKKQTGSETLKEDIKKGGSNTKSRQTAPHREQSALKDWISVAFDTMFF